MKKAPLLLGFALASALSIPAMAEPDRASTAEHWTAGALLGWGSRDAVEFGLGLRGGYTLPINVYLGATFMYHFGSSVSTGVGDVSANVYYLGAEGGYDFGVGPVIIRPYLGMGPAFIHVSRTINNISSGETATRFGFWPGGAVFYPINNFFVGGEMRILIVTDSDATSFNIFANGGMQF